MKKLPIIKSIIFLAIALLCTLPSFAKRVLSPSVVLTGTTSASTTVVALTQNTKFSCYADIISPVNITGDYWVAPTGSDLTALTTKIGKYDKLVSKANIRLRVLEAQPGACMPDNFTFTVNVSYKALTTGMVYDAIPKTVQLKVEYKKGQGLKYKNVDAFQMDNTMLLSCFLTSYTSTSSTPNIDIRNFVELQAELDYDYLPNEATIFNTSSTQIDITGPPSSLVSAWRLRLVPFLSFTTTANQEHIDLKTEIRNVANTPELTAAVPADIVNWIDSVEIQWTFTEDEFFKLNGSNEFEKLKYNNTTFPLIPNFNEYTISVVLPFANPLTYRISNVFENGILCFRARFIGRLAQKSGSTITGVTTVQCPWSDLLNRADLINVDYPSIATIPGTVPLGYALGIRINTFSPKLNWIFNCTYAEDGKKKEVINYFDGTLKSRQTITTSNTDAFALIKETIYDFQGRPAIEVLPVPSSIKSLNYVANFNKVNSTTAYTAANFDFNSSSNCTTPTSGMHNGSGAARYYSELNNWLTGNNISNKNQYIPSSGNATNGFFPFVQTVYTPDNTGRVKYTTQPGLGFQMGSNRETQYFYGRPEQEELDRLFGAEVGFAEHYTKDIVRDANGQYSVSIKNLSGKVIATSLAGNKPATLEELPSSFDEQNIEVDLLQYSQASIDNGDGYLLTAPLTATRDQLFKFKYSLNAANYSQQCTTANNTVSTAFCLDCVYNLEISITNECGEELLRGNGANNSVAPIKRKIGPGIINDACNPTESAYNINTDAAIAQDVENGFINLTLSAGQYYITRKITIDKEARENYIRNIVPNRLCKTLDQFEDEEERKVDLLQCNPCKDYLDIKKTTGNKRDNYINLIYTKRFDTPSLESPAPSTATVVERKRLLGLEFDAAVEKCEIQRGTTCKSYKQILLADVSPDSLYGSLEPEPRPSGSIYSVFTNTARSYKTMTFFHNAPSPIAGKSFLYELTPSELKENWKPEYAEALMPLHPEYFHYLACTQLDQSKNFDIDFNTTHTHEQAVEAKYLESVGSGLTENNDPFINTPAVAAFATTFTNNINNNAANALGISLTQVPALTGLSLQKVAIYIAFCKNASQPGNCINDAFNNITNCDYRAKNLYWNTYKALYQGIKANSYLAYTNTLKSMSSSNWSNVSSNNLRFEHAASVPTTTAGVKDLNKDAILDRCNSACQNMADGWISKLSKCNFGGDPATINTNITALKNALIAVCKEGCDINNPLGSSSVKPNSTNIYRSFQEAFQALGYINGAECSIDSIKFPKPYDGNATPASAKNNPLAFPQIDFCAEGLNPCILYGNCNISLTNGGTPACSLVVNTDNNSDIKTLINQFDNQTCLNGNCFDCSKFRELCQEYFNKPDEFITSFSLAAFINEELGFNMSEKDYTSFMASCLGYATLNDALTALGSEADLVAAYKNAYIIHKLDHAYLNNMEYNRSNGYQYSAGNPNVYPDGVYDAQRQVFKNTPCQILSELFYSGDIDPKSTTLAADLLRLIKGNDINSDGMYPNVLLSMWAKAGITSDDDIKAKIQAMLCECNLLSYCECAPSVPTLEEPCEKCADLEAIIKDAFTGENASIGTALGITKVDELLSLVLTEGDNANITRIITLFGALNKTGLGAPTEFPDDPLLKAKAILEWLRTIMAKCGKYNYPIDRPISFSCTEFNTFILTHTTAADGEPPLPNIFYDFSQTSINAMIELYKKVIGSKFASILPIPNFSTDPTYPNYNRIKDWLFSRMQQCNNPRISGPLFDVCSDHNIDDILVAANNSDAGKIALIQYYFAHNSGYENLWAGPFDVYNAKFNYNGFSIDNYQDYRNALEAQLSLCNLCSKFQASLNAFQAVSGNPNPATILASLNSDYTAAQKADITALYSYIDANSSYFKNFAKMNGRAYNASNYWQMKAILKALYCQCGGAASESVCAPVDRCKVFNSLLSVKMTEFGVSNLHDLVNDETTLGQNRLKILYSTYLLYIGVSNAIDPNLAYEKAKVNIVDILCACAIDTKYCPDKLVQCNGSSTSTNCYLPNARALALLKALQEISKGGNTFIADRAFTLTQEMTKNLFSNNPVVISTTHVVSNNYDPNYSSFNINTGERFLANIHLGVKEMNLVPNRISSLLKKVVLINASAIDIENNLTYSTHYQNILSISDLVPVYLPGTNTPTRFFVIKARRMDFCTNQPKTIYINGYFQDELSSSVNCSIKCAKLCSNNSTVMDPCEETLLRAAQNNAWYKYNEYLKSTIEQERRNYTQKCLASLKANETFTKTFTDNQYHYTLYYYDAAGNLLKTVPPKGVRFLNPTQIAAIKAARAADWQNHVNNTTVALPASTNNVHVLETQYQYNTLNQLVWQQTPDAGISRFGYDHVGRLILSQNAKQADNPSPAGTHSYTRYDALGRIVEVGQVSNSLLSLTNTYDNNGPRNLESEEFNNNNIYLASNRIQITATYYNSDISPLGTNYTLNNTRNRVAKVAHFAAAPLPPAETLPTHAIMYNYDVQGNVKNIYRYTQSLIGLDQAIQSVDYDFDVISGKVQSVSYQQGKADQYIHHYKYDAENRLVSSYSAPRHELIDKTANNTQNNMGLDAAYQYYMHGPLARTELGELKVQGLDYAYTMQGWLKGVNSAALQAMTDMGKDGYTIPVANTTAFTNTNTNTALDEMGFILHYFNTDYTQIGSAPTAIGSTNTAQWLFNSNAALGQDNLYNGNISQMVTSIRKLMGSNKPLAANYRYDQLNRLASALYLENFDVSTNTWSTTGSYTSNWSNQFVYDANGNIINQMRNGVGDATQRQMDNLTYYYHTGTNRLKYVSDIVPSTNYADDIDNQEDAGANSVNYEYDAIGNLISDKAEQIQDIKWNLYGKIQSITRTGASNKPNLEFEYTPDGHRAVKIVIPKDITKPRIYTYYMRDAQGNILATYEREFNRTVNFAAIQYDDLNTKLRTEQGTAQFATFIAQNHYNEIGLQNSLLASVTNNTTNKMAYYNQSDLYNYLSYSSNLTIANNTIAQYTNEEFFTILIQNTGINTATDLTYKMQMRKNANPDQLSLAEHILGNPNLRTAFFAYLITEDAYEYIFDALGIEYNREFESDMEKLTEYIQSNGLANLINTCNQYTGIDDYNSQDIAKQAINHLFDIDIDFRNGIFNIFEFKELFYTSGSSTIGSFSAGQFPLVNIISWLSNSSSVLRAKALTPIGDLTDFITWTKINEPVEQFMSKAITVDPLPVNAFQAASNRYCTGTTCTTNGVKEYFSRISAFYGQSLTDKLLNTYLSGSAFFVDKLMLNEWHIFGSSRLGIYRADILIASRQVTSTETGNSAVNQGNSTTVGTELIKPVLSFAAFSQIRGTKNYELSNHLGNVLVVVSDKKIYNCGNNQLINANFDVANNASFNNMYPLTLSAANMNLTGGKLNVNCLVDNAQVGGLFDIEGEAGKTYQVSFNFTKSASLTDVYLDINANYNTPGGGLRQNITYMGSNTNISYTFTAPQGVYRYKFVGVGTGTFSVDNFVVKEVSEGSYRAEVLTANDYSPFGAPMAGRSYKADNVLIKNTVSTSNFITGVDGWQASGIATLSNVYGNVRAVTTNTTTPTVINSGLKKVFSTEPNKTYRIKFKLNLRGWPFLYVKDLATAGNVLSVESHLSPGDYSYVFTAIGYQTQVEFLEVVKASSELQLCNFTLEEVDAESGFRFGFNSMPKDDEINGEGNVYDFGARMYDARLGKWLSLDPLQAKYPGLSPYNFCANNPIIFVDDDGKDFRYTVKVVTDTRTGKKYAEIGIETTIHTYGKDAANTNHSYSNKFGASVTVDGVTYQATVKVDVKFVSHESQESAQTAMQAGDNMMQVDRSLTNDQMTVMGGVPSGESPVSDDVKGYAQRGGTNANVRSTDSEVMDHEALHEVGLIERYITVNGYPIPDKGYQNTSMGGVKTGKLAASDYKDLATTVLIDSGGKSTKTPDGEKKFNVFNKILKFATTVSQNPTGQPTASQKDKAAKDESKKK